MKTILAFINKTHKCINLRAYMQCFVLCRPDEIPFVQIESKRNAQKEKE